MVSVQVHGVADAENTRVGCAGGYSDECKRWVPPDDACITLDGRELCVPCFVAEAAAKNADPERGRVLQELWERLR